MQASPPPFLSAAPHSEPRNHTASPGAVPAPAARGRRSAAREARWMDVLTLPSVPEQDRIWGRSPRGRCGLTSVCTRRHPGAGRGSGRPGAPGAGCRGRQAILSGLPGSFLPTSCSPCVIELFQSVTRLFCMCHRLARLAVCVCVHARVYGHEVVYVCMCVAWVWVCLYRYECVCRVCTCVQCVGVYSVGVRCVYMRVQCVCHVCMCTMCVLCGCAVCVHVYTVCVCCVYSA